MAEKSPASERIERYNRLKGERESVWDTLWQQIFDYELPRKSNITSSKSPGIEGYVDRLYDDTISDANQVLASGLVTNTTPATERWAVYESSYQFQTEYGEIADVSKWFSEVSEITLKILSGTNLYSALHELHLERNTGCTSALYIEEGRKRPINFKCIPLGTYVFALDDEGDVDTFQREFKLTARQAVQKFGVENVGDKIRKAFQNEKERDKEFCFLHSVYPREERKAGGADSLNKRFVSCYDFIEDKHEIQEGGYDEMPYIVTRFLTWPGEIWGYGPGIAVLPIVRQINQMEKDMDKLAEVAADPRLLVPSGMVGNIDLTAGGVTPIDESAGQFGQPREWLTGGRYDIGKDRSEQKREAIRKAFFNELFQMLGQMEPGRLTAYEVMQRVSEKLELFTPAFQRLTTELLEPMMIRIFGILFRGGYYPSVPNQLIIPVGANERGEPVTELALPKVSFQSKMALAIRALENKSFVEFLQIFSPVFQIRPETMDNFDWDRAARKIFGNLGNPADQLMDEQERDAMREERAQQQQQMMALQAAESVGKTVGQVGKAPAEMREAMGLG